MGGARSPAAEEQDHRVTLMRQAMSELQEIQRELVLIAERRGGKPLTEHIRDIQRRLRTLSSKIADLPDQGPFVSLKQHIRMVRGSADVIAASLAQGGDATTELNQLIGSIQDYDDDF